MAYAIELTRAASKDLADLPKDILKRVDTHILALADDPRPQGVETVKGGSGLLRIRVGDYRVLYEVDDQALTVLIVKIRHRREAYRGL